MLSGTDLPPTAGDLPAPPPSGPDVLPGAIPEPPAKSDPGDRESAVEFGALRTIKSGLQPGKGPSWWVWVSPLPPTHAVVTCLILWLLGMGVAVAVFGISRAVADDQPEGQTVPLALVVPTFVALVASLVALMR